MPRIGELPKIPLLQLDNADPALLEELIGAIGGVAATGAFTLGDEVAAFEREFADYCEAEHAIGVSSGTEALVLALKALGIGPGDEVVVPANSFIASAEAVSLAGATPRFADVDPETHLLRADHVEAVLTPRVRAIIAVHLFGATVDLDPILELAAGAGIAVVEDAAQAHGARLRGRRVGGIGTVGCFSFYPTKNLGAWGDGGAVTTQDAELAERVRLLRSHGENPRYHHRIVGTTARLDAIQAAVLRRKLRRLDGWNDRRRALAGALREALAGSVAVPSANPGAHGDHVHHLFVVRTPYRDALRAHLDAHGIATAVHYPDPIHRTEAYAGLGLGPGSLPVSEAHAAEICTLPLWPGMPDAAVARIAEAVHAFAGSLAHEPGARFDRGSEAETLAGRW